MSELQAVIGLGVGAVLAFFLLKWLTFSHIPALIKAFQDEMAKERELHRIAVERIVMALKDLDVRLTRIEFKAPKKEDR